MMDASVEADWISLLKPFLLWVSPFLALVFLVLLVVFWLRARRLGRQVYDLTLEVGASSRSLRTADRDLQSLFDQSSIAVFILDHRRREILYANNTALTAFGVSDADALTSRVIQNPEAWEESSFTLLEFEALLDKVTRTGLQVFEWRLPGGEQAPEWLDCSLSFITYLGNQSVLFTGVNITARKRNDALEKFQLRAMRAIASDSPLNQSLSQLVALVERLIPRARCAVFVHDAEQRRLRWTAGSSDLPSPFQDRLDELPVAFGAAGAGTAASIRERVVARDVRSDQRWDAFRDLAEQAGVRSSWAEPVIGANGELLGCVELYHDEVWTPSEDDVDRLTAPVSLASLAIERHHWQAKLEQMIVSEQSVRRISTNLLTLDMERVDEGIVGTCATMGDFFQADRVFICQLEEASHEISISHEWCIRALARLRPETGRKFPVIPSSLGVLFRESSPQVFDEENPLPPMLEFLAERLERGADKSVILGPIFRNERLTGFLGIQKTSASQAWTPARTETVQLMASLIGAVMTRQELVNSLTFQAVHDQLTGLYNRHKLENFLKQEVARCSRYSSVFSLIIFDLDHFKSINDRFGHNEGDSVLSTVAQLVDQNVRESEVAGRWGGEEFLILLPETGTDSAIAVAERIRETIAQHRFSIPEPVTISAGVATFRAGDDPHQLVQRADAALYNAKDAGRNRVISAL